MSQLGGSLELEKNRDSAHESLCTLALMPHIDAPVPSPTRAATVSGCRLSMEREDAFFHKVVGEGGHKNYVERFGSYDAKKGVREVNPKTMGFRLASAQEPDAMHSRLGNDALELKVRHCQGATLPNSTLANKYAVHRHDLTKAAKDRLKLEKDLRAAMTWIKALRDAATTSTEVTLEAQLRDHRPPPELLEMLGISSLQLDEDTNDPCAALAELLRHCHFHARGSSQQPTGEYLPTRHELDCVLEHGGWAKVQVEMLFSNSNLDDESKLGMIQSIVRGSISGKMPTTLEACDALVALLEAKGEDIMKRLTGMAPKTVGSFGTFVGRMIEAIQMTNDERVQTKENYSRTCMLNTEYVGTMDFKLEESDHYFLWRKGYLTASMWLEKRTKKSKDKKKLVAKGIAKELKKEAEAVRAASEALNEAASYDSATAAPSAAEPAVHEDTSNGPIGAVQTHLSKLQANQALSAEEKLDILGRHLQRMASSAAPASKMHRKDSSAVSVEARIASEPRR